MRGGFLSQNNDGWWDLHYFCKISLNLLNYLHTVKPVNKGHPWEYIAHSLYIQMFFYLEVIHMLTYLIKDRLLKCGRYLKGGLFLKVVFDTGLNVLKI